MKNCRSIPDLDMDSTSLNVKALRHALITVRKMDHQLIHRLKLMQSSRNSRRHVRNARKLRRRELKSMEIIMP